MRNSRVEIERRLRIMAKNKVDMMLGLYKWPDGRPPVLPNGTPKVSDRELLRSVGYSETYKEAKQKLFGDPYFQNRVKVEMTRREKKHGELVPHDATRVCTVRNLIFDELEARLEDDPGSFTRQELLSAAEKFELLSRQTAPSHPAAQNDKMQQFNAFISRTVNVMEPLERERFVDTAQGAANDRIAHLQKMIDLANVVEEDGDDSDVIDAEIDPVGT